MASKTLTTMQRAKTFERHLNRPVDGLFLAVFRIVLGVTFCFQFGKYLSEEWVEYFYVQPNFFFKYYGFDWVKPLPGHWMRTHFQMMWIVSALVAAGLFYRISSLLLALGYTYIFLLDKAQYQNHYYLLVLTSWLMVFLPANRLWSLDCVLFRRKSRTIPVWTLWLLRLQVGLPYFFGGVAKINSDWMHGQPMRMKLASSTWYPIIGPAFTQEWCVQVFVWGGLLLDLLIVPLLLWKRSRTLAYCVVVGFHLMNATLFQIGVFPWFMIFATTVYFAPDGMRFAVSPKTARQPTKPPSIAEPCTQAPGIIRSRLLLAAMGLYVVCQLVLPWRHLLYEGNVSWTEEGHYYSWHMKLRDKKTVCMFRWRNPETDEAGTINVLDYISRQQARFSSCDPRMMVQLAHFLKDELRSQDVGDCEILALNLASLNGRKPQPIVNPTLNLADIPLNFTLPRNVYTKLSEPLRPFDTWKRPPNEWPVCVEFPNREFWFGTSTPPERQSTAASQPMSRLSASIQH